ncbi:MAG: hypothetical protein ACREBW_04860 [Candidatus Micrarchaeaceae archaeon]
MTDGQWESARYSSEAFRFVNKSSDFNNAFRCEKLAETIVHPKVITYQPECHTWIENFDWVLRYAVPPYRLAIIPDSFLQPPSYFFNFFKGDASTDQVGIPQLIKVNPERRDSLSSLTPNDIKSTVAVDVGVGILQKQTTLGDPKLQTAAIRQSLVSTFSVQKGIWVLQKHPAPDDFFLEIIGHGDSSSKTPKSRSSFPIWQ